MLVPCLVYGGEGGENLLLGLPLVTEKILEAS